MFASSCKLASHAIDADVENLTDASSAGILADTIETQVDSRSRADCVVSGGLPSDTKTGPGRDADIRDLALVLAVGVSVATFVFVVDRWGLPLDREQVLAWTLGFVVVVSLTGSHRFDAIRAVRDWSVFAVLLVVYDYSRGLADGLGMPLQIEAPIIFDRALFPGDVPTVELQARLGPFDGQRWWEAAIAVTYLTHFFVPYVVTAYLWLRNRPCWRAWIGQFGFLTTLGLAGYVLLPTMPPWLASANGFLPTIERTALRGWRVFDLHIAEVLIHKGQTAANAVAAFPSLHAAYPALLTMFFWPRSGRWGRAALVSYTLAMALTLVITGEHYVVDILGGWLAAGIAVLVWKRLSARPSVSQWLTTGRSPFARRIGFSRSIGS